MKPLFAFLAIFISPVVYNVESAETTVEYSVDSTLHAVHGKFSLKRAVLNIDPANQDALLANFSSGTVEDFSTSGLG